MTDDDEEEDNKSPEETKAIEDAKTPELKKAEAEGWERKQIKDTAETPQVFENAESPALKEAKAENQEIKKMEEETAETLQVLDLNNAAETRSPATSAMGTDAPTETPQEKK